MIKERVKANVVKIQSMIERACQKVNRNHEEITIVGATKYTDASGILECAHAGITTIGENKVQQAMEKIDELRGSTEKIDWHFIGHLQTNKVKNVLPHFSLIHSLDRYSLAAEINKQAKKNGNTMQCLIQVNVSGELSKYGVAKHDAIDLAKRIEELQHIEVIGLMTMAPYFDDPELSRPVFSSLRFLKEEIQQLELANYRLQHLSMGMSNDFVVAIEEGATMIRLGSILFDDQD